MITICKDSLEEMNSNFRTDSEQSFCFPVRLIGWCINHPDLI